MLGEGSFGKTFEAFRTDWIAGKEIRKHVAIKVLNPSVLTSESRRFQFIQELDALSEFQHPNLIHYIRCGEEKGEVYYAMDLCRGGDLSRLVRRYGPLPERAVAHIALQVAAGLREVHQRHRMVHRDIKPSNIMLADELKEDLDRKHLAYRFEQQDSLCRVVDFGLVNFAMNAEGGPQRFVGSPLYASPEQIREQPVDGRADLYSLGMTLWYLAQGRGPLLDEDGQEIRDTATAMRRHTSPDDFEPELPSGLSPEFRAILARLIEKRPEKRYATASELQNVLRDYLSRVQAPDEAESVLLRLSEPLSAAYDLGEKVSARGLWPVYAAWDKQQGRAARVTVVAELTEGYSEAEIEEAAAGLCKTAAPTRDSAKPPSILPVHAVVLAADYLAFAEESTPQVVLSDLLKARGAARKPFTFSEILPLLRPLADGLDFLLQQGKEVIALNCDQVWICGSAATSMLQNPAVLTAPLTDWEDLAVRFSAMTAPPEKSLKLQQTGAASAGTTSGSMQLSADEAHPVPVFARLVYRILKGSEVAAAVSLAADAYVPDVGLSHASNNLIRDIICRQRPWGRVTAVLKELSSNEGVTKSAKSRAAVATIVSPGVVQSPYASAGSTQQLPWEAWTPGGEFVCSVSGRKVVLPATLPPRQLTPPPLPQWVGGGKPGGSNAQTISGPPERAEQMKAFWGQGAPAGSTGAASTMGSSANQTSGLSTPPGPTGNKLGLWIIGVAFLLLLGMGALAWHAVLEAKNRDRFVGEKAGDRKIVGGLAFRWCPPTGPAGFKMGSPDSEVGRNMEEAQHQVILTRGYWLSEKVVTQKQWQELMGGGIREQAQKALNDDRTYNGKTIRATHFVEKKDVDTQIAEPNPDMPMFWIEADEADEFCHRLADREHATKALPEGWDARLPTEAQWEYACRAGTTGATYAGELTIEGTCNAPALDPIAWYAGNSGVGYQGRGWDVSGWKETQFKFAHAGPRLSGLKKPNPWGLEDMIGNVAQWCQDWSAPYPGGMLVDPVGPAVAGSNRVLRGSGWGWYARTCRAANRSSYSYSFRDNDEGIRVALVKAEEPRAPHRSPDAPTPPPTPPPTPATPVPLLTPTDPYAGRNAGDSKTVNGVKFRWCPPTGPAGFQMGSPADETGRDNDEPQHPVVFTQGFWIAETETTQGEWEALMGIGVKDIVTRMLADNNLHDLGGKPQTWRAYLNTNKNEAQTLIGEESPALPIYFVSWYDIMDYCQRATDFAHAKGLAPANWEVRLPTEAQWEYACRAGSTGMTPAGNPEILGAYNAPLLDGIAWYGGNSGVGFTGRGWNRANVKDRQYEFTYAGPREPRQKKPNAWQIYDMLGNVGEWTNDWYANYSHAPSPDSVQMEGHWHRVVRGGSWETEGAQCRAASRFSEPSGFRSSQIGFRAIIAPITTPPLPAALPLEQRLPGHDAGEARLIAGMPFRWCPPTGAQGFSMGSPVSEAGHQEDETAHTVILNRGFWMAETQLTQFQWKDLMGVGVREQATKALADDTRYKISGKMQTFREFAGLGRNDVDKLTYGDGPTKPMHYVNWAEAVEYCRRLTQAERTAGRLPATWEFRLPTEAQWEYACRAGTKTSTYIGDMKIIGENNGTLLNQIAWYGGNSGVNYSGEGWAAGDYPNKEFQFDTAGPRGVAQKQANPWGLRDMLGNVYQWCEDWYDDYPQGVVTDPVSAQPGDERSARGGAWDATAMDCRAARRDGITPTYRDNDLGFRIILAPTKR